MSDGAQVVDVITILLLVVIIISHLIGCYLLVCIYRNGDGTIQEVLLINLSVVACCGGVVSLFAHLMRFSPVFHGMHAIFFHSPFLSSIYGLNRL